MAKKDLVVVGNGMVGHRFIELLLESDQRDDWHIVTFCEEPRLAYDRVNLTGFFAGKTAERPVAGHAPTATRTPASRCTWATGSAAIDRAAPAGPLRGRRRIPYDKLVLATGSCAVRAADPRARRAGLLRLPHDRGPRARSAPGPTQRRGPAWSSAAACSASRRPTRCTQLGLETHVVEFAPRLMALQVDDGGGGDPPRAASRRSASSVHTGKIDQPRSSPARAAGSRALQLRRRRRAGRPTWSSSPPASAPRDELARAARPDHRRARRHRHRRALPHHRPATSSPSASARSYEGRTYGLVAPGYQMAARRRRHARRRATTASAAST